VIVKGTSGDIEFSYTYAMDNICDSIVYDTKGGGTLSDGGYEDITLVLAISGDGKTLTDAPLLLSVDTSSTSDTTHGLIACTGRNGVIQVNEIDVVYSGDGPLLNAQSSSLTVAVTPVAINLDTVTSASITGTLTSSGTGLSNQPITIYLINEFDSSQAILGTTETEADGSYNYNWDVIGMNTGNYMLKAVYSGIKDYAASSAETSVSISNSLFPLPESALGTLIAIFSCFGAFIVYKYRSKAQFIPRLR
jgi:5-hydroxyisourate hydrolase-like protein (transthyretin family)